jgi:hypothetical protein
LEGETQPNSNVLFSVVFENEASTPLIGLESKTRVIFYNTGVTRIVLELAYKLFLLSPACEHQPIHLLDKGWLEMW